MEKKIITPMEKVKNEFILFKRLIGLNFNEINLNKCDSKLYVENYCGEKFEYLNKGVKSDFIRLFKFGAKGDDIVLSFSFKYINKTENEYEIKVSCSKENEKIKHFSKIKNYTVKEFKDKLKEINELLISNKIENNKILNLVQEKLLEFNFLNLLEDKKYFKYSKQK